MITLPASFVSDIIGYVGDFMTDLSPYLTLIIGVLLGTVVIEIIIGALRK